MAIPSEGTIIAGIAAALGAITTYLMGRRKTSGEVHTTDADELWAQEGKFRRDLQETITNLRQRVDHLEKEKARCMEELAALRGQITGLMERHGKGAQEDG